MAEDDSFFEKFWEALECYNAINLDIAIPESLKRRMQSKANAKQIIGNQTYIEDDCEHDGVVYTKQRDPPGQKCVYILPGPNEKETYRLSTFVHFPSTSLVDVRALAHYGFLWTGYKDRVKCFSCGSNVFDWKVTDEPDHVKWHYRGCELIQGTDTRNQPIFKKTRLVFKGKSSSPTSSRDSGYESEKSLDIGNVRGLPERKIKQSPGPCVGIDEIPSTSSSSSVKTNVVSISGEYNSFTGITLHYSQFPCLNPANPHMKDYLTRLQTFISGWPSFKVKASVQSLASAGLYYLGERDRAKCWYCNGGIQNWERDDDPFVEHAKWFPGCEYILQCKGVDFVKEVVQKYPNIRRPVLRNSRFDHITCRLINPTNSNNGEKSSSSLDSDDKSAGSILNSYSPAPTESQTDEISNSTIQRHFEQSALQMGFNKVQIDSVIKRQIRIHGRNFKNIDEFFDALCVEPNADEPMEVNHEPENMETNQRAEDIFRHAAEQSSKEVRRNTNKNGNMTQSKVQVKKSEKGANLNKRLAELEQERKCKACFENIADSLLMQCGHLSLCRRCAQGAKVCPICKQKITSVIKTYLV